MDNGWLIAGGEKSAVVSMASAPIYEVKRLTARVQRFRFA
jgi:hypothetical protein